MAKKITPVLSRTGDRFIKAATFFEAVDTIRLAGAEDEFLKACAEKNIGATVTEEHLNFVKTFLAGFVNNSPASTSFEALRPGLGRIVRSNPRCD